MSDSQPSSERLPRPDEPGRALLILAQCANLRPMTPAEVSGFAGVESADPRIGSVGGLTVVVDGARLDYFDARSVSWTNLDWTCFRLVSSLAEGEQ